MKFSGLQKLTLLDFPGKVACTVFTAGCNLRCPFCHNASLVYNRAEEIPYNEVISFLKKRAGLLDGVCLTGGEPLLNIEAADFLRTAKELGYSVKLDTNGCYPDRLKAIVQEGIVDYVAMDIKNSLESYPKTVGIENFDTAPIKESARFLMNCGVDYEFRTTLVNELHTLDDMHRIGEWLAGAKRYFLQGFVDSGDLIGENLSAVSEENTQKMLKILNWNIPSAQIRGR